MKPKKQEQQPEKQDQMADSATKIAGEQASASADDLAALASGTKFVTLQKRRTKHEITLKDGVVVQASANVRQQMMGWTTDRVLDWADRCRVNVFVSDDGKTLGAQVQTRPIQQPVQ